MPSHPFIWITALWVGTAFAGAQAQGGGDGLCTLSQVSAAHDAASLRVIMENCEDRTEVLAQAALKLNELPIPPVRKLSMAPVVPGAEFERVRLEADVFFRVLEAYPVPEAFTKLDELVQRMNTGTRVETIRVVGGQDLNERQLPSFKLAAQRAEFVRRYFQAAGWPVDAPVVVMARAPQQPDTPLGRARDRSAAVSVDVLRQRVPR